MAANLIAQLQNEFSDDVIGRLASYLGETPAKTQRAVGYAIPAVVGGLFQKAQASGGAQDLLGTLQRGGFDGKSIGDMASLARSATRSSDLVRSGGTVVSSVFGGRQDTLTDSIATASGLGKQSSSSLLALTASYVASLVSKEATAAAAPSLGHRDRTWQESRPAVFPKCAPPRVRRGRETWSFELAQVGPSIGGDLTSTCRGIARHATAWCGAAGLKSEALPDRPVLAVFFPRRVGPRID